MCRNSLHSLRQKEKIRRGRRRECAWKDERKKQRQTWRDWAGWWGEWVWQAGGHIRYFSMRVQELILWARHGERLCTCQLDSIWKTQRGEGTQKGWILSVKVCMCVRVRDSEHDTYISPWGRNISVILLSSVKYWCIICASVNVSLCVYMYNPPSPPLTLPRERYSTVGVREGEQKAKAENGGCYCKQWETCDTSIVPAAL